MTSKTFWADSVERAVKTFAQSLVALFLGDQALNVLSVDWTTASAVSGTAALVSVLTSVASGQVGPDKGSASLV